MRSPTRPENQCAEQSPGSFSSGGRAQEKPDRFRAPATFAPGPIPAAFAGVDLARYCDDRNSRAPEREKALQEAVAAGVFARVDRAYFRSQFSFQLFLDFILITDAVQQLSADRFSGCVGPMVDMLDCLVPAESALFDCAA